MKLAMTDEAIARRMSRIGDQVRYASRPSFIRTTIAETIVLAGVLAALLFLYVCLPA